MKLEEINEQYIKRIYKQFEVLDFKYDTSLKITYYHKKEKELWIHSVGYEDFMCDIKKFLFKKGFNLVSRLNINTCVVNVGEPYYEISIECLDDRPFSFDRTFKDDNELNAVIKTANFLWEFV